MAYRQPNGKNTKLTFGQYPEVTLSEARIKCAEANKQRAAGVDPAQVKRQEKLSKTVAAENTFEAVANSWIEKVLSEKAAATQEKTQNWLKKDVFPYIGKMPIASIKPMDILATVRKMEARHALDSACSFAGSIDPLSLTLPPGSRERRDPVVRTLKPQFFQVLVDLFKRAPLLPRSTCFDLEHG
jgi:hypothetical protein